jgi:hypothetical protein
MLSENKPKYNAKELKSLAGYIQIHKHAYRST